MQYMVCKELIISILDFLHGLSSELEGKAEGAVVE